MLYNYKVKSLINSLEGLDAATVIHSVYNDRTSREVLDFSNAVTYNLVNGKIEKSKANSSNEFTTVENEHYTTKKLVLPNVKVGSIIEYEVSILSPFLNLVPEFKFQTNYPTHYCELVTKYPEYYYYKTFMKGALTPVVTSIVKERTINVSEKVVDEDNGFTRGVNYNHHTYKYNENNKTYVLKYIPALNDEKYVGNINNYRSSISHELEKYSSSASDTKYYSQNWDEVTKYIYESEKFGGELNQKKYFESTVDELIKGVVSRDEKIDLIFNYVKSNYKWNQWIGYFADKGLKNLFKTKVGNAAEINLLLISMLRYANIDVNPVLLNTRDAGLAFFPTLRGFNYVIAGVEIQDDLIFLDATSLYSTPNMLPVSDLNWVGRIIRPNGSSAEVSLLPRVESVNNTVLSVEIDETGKIKGSGRILNSGYFGFEKRERLNKLSEESQKKLFNEVNSSIDCKEYKIKDQNELNKPFAELFTFESNKYVDVINTDLYLNPMLFLSVDHSDFVASERSYPVDFVFPLSKKMVVNIKIPEGYEVKYVPQNKTSVSSVNDMGFNYVVKQDANAIQIATVININKSFILPKDYPDMKRVFDELVTSHKEKIILKKI